jgi:replicative DNA helicase
MANFVGFDGNFLDAILWLLITDLKFMREYGDQIKPDMFQDKVRFLIAGYTREFYEESHCVPKQLFKTYAQDRINKDRVDNATAKLLLAHIDKIGAEQKQIALAYVTQRLSHFFDLNLVSGVATVLQQAAERGDTEEAKRVLKQAVSKFSTKIKSTKPVDYFANIRQRTVRREVVLSQEDGVHFFIPTLERRGIYAHRGEVTLIIAPSKRGKSICLTHVGKCAVFSGHNVLHVSLENPIQMVEDRYDAMFTGLSVTELRLLADMLITSMEEVRGLAKGRLHILWRMANTYSPYDLKADIEQLRAEGNRIDTVIVDYGELMQPIGKYSGEAKMRADRGDIFMHLRAVATDMDVTVVTAQQTPLKKKTKFRLGMEDGQESSMPAQHSSLILTLNQTEDEKDANEMRIRVDGYWHGTTAFEDILVKQDFDRMQFCVEEVPLKSGVEAAKSKVKP